MKKILFSAVLLVSGSLLVSTPAQAQAGKNVTGPQPDKATVAVRPTHGAVVSTVAHTTPLTGAAKGATVSAVARSSARGDRNHSGHANHSQGNHQGGNGHRGH